MLKDKLIHFIQSTVITCLSQIAILIIGFMFWYWLLGTWSQTAGAIVGIFTAAILLLIMNSKSNSYYDGTSKKKESQEALKNKIVQEAALKSCKYFILAFYKLGLKTGITSTIYNEPTNEFFQITFRKIQINEAVQASNLRGGMQAANETEKEISLKANTAKTGKTYH